MSDYKNNDFDIVIFIKGKRETILIFHRVSCYRYLKRRKDYTSRGYWIGPFSNIRQIENTLKEHKCALFSHYTEIRSCDNNADKCLTQKELNMLLNDIKDDRILNTANKNYSKILDEWLLDYFISNEPKGFNCRICDKYFQDRGFQNPKKHLLIHKKLFETVIHYQIQEQKRHFIDLITHQDIHASYDFFRQILLRLRPWNKNQEFQNITFSFPDDNYHIQIEFIFRFGKPWKEKWITLTDFDVRLKFIINNCIIQLMELKKGFAGGYYEPLREGVPIIEHELRHGAYQRIYYLLENLLKNIHELPEILLIPSYLINQLGHEISAEDNIDSYLTYWINSYDKYL